MLEDIKKSFPDGLADTSEKIYVNNNNLWDTVNSYLKHCRGLEPQDEALLYIQNNLKDSVVEKEKIYITTGNLTIGKTKNDLIKYWGIPVSEKSIGDTIKFTLPQLRFFNSSASKMNVPPPSQISSMMYKSNP